jgi:hypothetical protein
MSEYVQAILIAPRTHYTCSLPLKVRRKYIYSYEDRLIQLYELKSFLKFTILLAKLRVTMNVFL